MLVKIANREYSDQTASFLLNQEGLLSVLSKSMCIKYMYWLTA